MGAGRAAPPRRHRCLPWTMDRRDRRRRAGAAGTGRGNRTGRRAFGCRLAPDPGRQLHRRAVGALGLGRVIWQRRLCRAVPQRREALGRPARASRGDALGRPGAGAGSAPRPPRRPQHFRHAGAARPLFERSRPGSAGQRRYRQLCAQPAPHPDPILEMLCEPQGLPRGAVRVADRAVRRALPDPLLSQGTPGTGVMASVVMADDGIAFDGAMAEAGPLGGAETAFVALAEALAARGHQVEARSNCATPLRHKGVDWAPLANGVPERCDLYIGNRGHWLIDGGREIIPYGVLERFRQAETREPPLPRAIFTSNPLRGLDWLLELWV